MKALVDGVRDVLNPIHKNTVADALERLTEEESLTEVYHYNQHITLKKDIWGNFMGTTSFRSLTV
jgi:hypothetical protein